MNQLWESRLKRISEREKKIYKNNLPFECPPKARAYIGSQCSEMGGGHFTETMPPYFCNPVLDIIFLQIAYSSSAEPHLPAPGRIGHPLCSCTA